jgi:putative sterol carrier protein
MATVAEIMAAMPSRFNAEAAGDLNATVLFNLAGDDGGVWHVRIDDGECMVNEGPTEDPTATIMMEAEDYAAMVTGELNAINAFMTGKVRVEGDLNTVMKFQSIFM